MMLSELLDSLPASQGSTMPATDVGVGAVTDRAEDVRPGDVFVAIRGARVDGHTCIPSHAGVAIVEREVTVVGPTMVRVRSTTQALGPLCAKRLGNPADKLVMVGVTGTNGKTSVTTLVAHIARQAGWSAGVIGTVGHSLNGEAVGEGFTTPTAPQLQALLNTFVQRGARLVAMEVSSIGLGAHRVDGVRFSATAWTNLTRDHLDYHGSMLAYGEAKRRLFTELRREGAVAVVNGGDAEVQRLTADLDGRVAFNSADGWKAEVLRHTLAGLDLMVTSPEGVQTAATCQLIGAHNVENVLCAWALCRAVGLSDTAVVTGLASFAGVPGRLERIAQHPFAVFVDYAHTDDALRRVLTQLRALTPGKLIVVFGCGGDRDPGKRAPMGQAARLADVIVLTSDNPRSESPEVIIAAVSVGLGDREHQVEPDRRTAIALALSVARPGDLVLVAGKGHERTQTIGDAVLPFDDRDVCRELLSVNHDL